MATMEDRILGEKLHYYCSSSEGEEDDEDEEKKEEKEDGFDIEASRQQQADNISEKAYLEGPRSHNTGIKGVKEDARLYQRFILEKEQERIDELAKAAERFVLTEPPKSDSDLDESDDDFMAAYRAKRMSELRQYEPKFGVVLELTDTNFVETIDSAKSTVNVVVYIYEERMKACRRYKADLVRIAQDWPHCMICCIRASDANMSPQFISQGLPAFLMYRDGDVQKTWLGITQYVGESATYDELTESMQDNGILPYSDLS